MKFVPILKKGAGNRPFPKKKGGFPLVVRKGREMNTNGGTEACNE